MMHGGPLTSLCAFVRWQPGKRPNKHYCRLMRPSAMALTFLRHEVQSHGLTATHHTSHAAPKVLADRTQIQQVIVNLTVNAIQAMAHAERPQRTPVIRTTLSDPHTLCCTFEDSGPGIKPEHLDYLCDSFFTTKDAGMGLGLPICRSIIEAHGGYIRADNESACGGARFSFTLPAKLADC
jgi:signal transduction histidine kinase